MSGPVGVDLSQGAAALGVLAIRGADAARFLQGQLSADIEKLDVGASSFAGFHNPQGRVIALLAVYSMLVMAESATLTAGLVGTVPHELRGAALGLYSLAGFAGGALGPSLFGLALDLAGGKGSAAAWVAAYFAIGAGCLAAPLVARAFRGKALG